MAEFRTAMVWIGIRESNAIINTGNLTYDISTPFLTTRSRFIVKITEMIRIDCHETVSRFNTARGIHAHLITPLRPLCHFEMALDQSNVSLWTGKVPLARRITSLKSKLINFLPVDLHREFLKEHLIYTLIRIYVGVFSITVFFVVQTTFRPDNYIFIAVRMARLNIVCWYCVHCCTCKGWK